MWNSWGKISGETCVNWIYVDRIKNVHYNIAWLQTYNFKIDGLILDLLDSSRNAYTYHTWSIIKIMENLRGFKGAWLWFKLNIFLGFFSSNS